MCIGTTIGIMGDKEALKRAEDEADRILAWRRQAMVALALASEAARDDSVVTKADEKAAAELAQAKQRAAEIVAKAEEEGAKLRDAARAERATRADTWREMYDRARAAGWTAREIRDNGHAPPPRAPARRRHSGSRRTRGPEPPLDAGAASMAAHTSADPLPSNLRTP
ncbi:hypothetical protein [Amycolatopsis anabasis]|uniref:hypothetical protein n=1 Tax=Amycolatopsis anabasis TaxID=1840409 RepID=UPI001C55340D|nr:hypothetical protein [Amycolatopsis anabasis]